MNNVLRKKYLNSSCIEKATEPSSNKEVYNSIIGFVNFLIIMKVPTGIEKDELIRCKLVLENWSSNIYGCLVHLPAQAQKIKKHTKKGFLIIQKNGPF